MSKRLKSVPAFASEAEERTFWETHDSADYVDWSKAQRVVLPSLKPKTNSISLQLPKSDWGLRGRVWVNLGRFRGAAAWT